MYVQDDNLWSRMREGMNMKIDSIGGFEYQPLKNNQAESAKTSVAEEQDSVEISSEGMKASYDLTRVMRIHKESKSEIPSKEDSDYYWNARANNKDLDQSLYDADKADAMKFVMQVQSILMKAVSGQKLSPEEQAMVNSDPALAQEISRRKSAAAAGISEDSTTI